MNLVYYKNCGDLYLLQAFLIAELFGTARSTITEHINNILKEGELSKETSVEISDRSLVRKIKCVFAI